MARFLLYHYRYDAERKERRNVLIGTFDELEPYEEAVAFHRSKLAELKSQDLAEPVENIFGVAR